MQKKLFYILMLSLAIVSFVARASFCDRFSSPLVYNETYLVTTSRAICDYRIQEGCFPLNLNALSEEQKGCQYDYFATEQTLVRDFSGLYYYGLLALVLLALLLLKGFSKLSNTIFGVGLVVWIGVFVMTTPLLIIEYPIAFLSQFIINKSHPYNAFGRINLEYKMREGCEFLYAVTRDDNAVLLSRGPDFSTPFTKEKIEGMDVNQFVNEVVAYSPTNGIQSNGDTWVVIPKDIKKSIDLPLSGLYGFVKPFHGR